MTLNPFGRALSPVEISSSRYLDALIAFRPETCLRMEDPPADPPANPPADPPADPPPANTNGNATDAQGRDLGYPKDTPVAEMTAEQKASYDKAKADERQAVRREWKSVTGERTPAQLKADLDELTRLRTERMTDSEKAVEAARTEGREAARREMAPRMAQVAFEAALGHVPDDQRSRLIEGIALDKFVTPEGDVDTAKVKDHVALIAPGKGGSGQQDFGQGRRGGGAKTSSIADGAQLYADRRGKSTSTS